MIKMQSENKYLGDEKFKKFLEHYKCPTPLAVVKMKFAGAKILGFVYNGKGDRKKYYRKGYGSKYYKNYYYYNYYSQGEERS